METLAAIDIGSNAMRMVIGEIDDHGDIRVLRKVREPVRLGKDVFACGEISRKTRDKAIETFRKFRDILAEHKVKRSKAVATSALREARDRDSFIREIKNASGIGIDVIDGIEEGRLVYSAVSHRLDLHDSLALLIDIGGGSVELTIADHGRLRASQSFKLGTVRLLRMLEEKGLKEKHLHGLIEEKTGPIQTFLTNELKGQRMDLAIGTGGNFECLGKLRVALLHKSSIFSMNRGELSELVEQISLMSVKERIQELRLRPDRADVLIPAALVAQAVMELARVDILTVPYVGLREGILAELGGVTEQSRITDKT